MERLKETDAELNCSDNETGSYSRQTVANIRFGDLMDDPLDCVLGSKGQGKPQSLRKQDSCLEEKGATKPQEKSPSSIANRMLTF